MNMAAAILSEPQPQLRAMHGGDLETIAVIEAQAYAFPWTPGIFRDCLRSNYECRALLLEGDIIGYGILSAGAGEAHLLNVCIAPAYQGHGHGRFLVEHMIGVARQRQAQRLFLEVRPSNRAALALYSTLGFNEISTRPNYYPTPNGREDAIVMAMELLPPEGWF